MVSSKFTKSILKGKKLEEDERRIAAGNSQKRPEELLREKEMLEKAEKSRRILDKKDDQVDNNLERSLKDQEAAEKMLQHATKTLKNAIDQ